ncbi:MAG: penicillin-binding protein [Dehalococcoidia bacterium]|nr:penicillin-binding protein [Dehalococcoidia bacterium]
MTHAHRYRRLRRGRRGAPAVSSKPLFVALIVPLLLVMVAVGSGLTVGAVSYYRDVTTGVLPPQQAIDARGGGAKIYDRNGTLLYQFLDPNYGYQTTVTLDQISPLIQQATIAAEDASFYSNPGVNVKGLTRAAIENLQPGDKFLQGTGGSSITQQLVKQLYFSPKQRQERSLSRKLKEAVLAVKLTQDYDKNQILTWYLNEVPYGGVLTGIEAASEGYFGIPAKDVNLAQAAFLAGLPQSPTDYDPFQHMERAKQRQSEVLDLMVKHGYIDQTTANFARLYQIKLNPKPQPFLAQHFVLYVADYIRRTLGEDALMRGGLSVLTTLDLNLNTQANLLLENNLRKYEQSSGGHNGAVVVINPPTGQILAMVGSRDYNRADIDGTVNAALALRSPGSTLKPFTYVTAFEQGWGPEWPIVDTPITYTSPGSPPFSPRNPDGRTRGVIPLRVALGNSFNIPAFKTILWAGVQNVINTAKSMGITTLDGRGLGPALTLGGSDVKLLDMVFGYATFANGGVQAGVRETQSLPAGNRQLEPNPILVVRNRAGDILMNNTKPQTQQIIKPEYAWLITNVLSNDVNRQITYGVGSSLNIPGYQVAAKTGTSEPFPNSKAIGDTWTYGYTPDVAVGVWVGNSDYKPMINILSTTIAGATWHSVMVAALNAAPERRPFVQPPGIVTATVCVPSGIVKPPNSTCPSVTGLFAADALAKQANNDAWWGGQQLPGAVPITARLSGIPAGITGWKLYLAQEYLRTLGTSRQPTPPPQARRGPAPIVPVAPVPQLQHQVAPVPQTDDRGRTPPRQQRRGR